VTAPVGRACDLGAGSGIVGLLLAQRDPAARVTLVELQPRLAGLARRNAEENRLADRVVVEERDLTRGDGQGARFDLVASNPPYQPVGSGPATPNQEEAIARHELRITLEALVSEMRRLLAPGGRAALVYPAERLVALLSTLDAAGLRPLRLRLVHSRAEEPARRALVEAKKGARGPLLIAPPLVVYQSDGSYSDEAKRALGD
jgi:tRNA1Val (adenine37-N6)-methyltransferase